jgi:hypothetical protein
VVRIDAGAAKVAMDAPAIGVEGGGGRGQGHLHLPCVWVRGSVAEPSGSEPGDHGALGFIFQHLGPRRKALASRIR